MNQILQPFRFIAVVLLVAGFLVCSFLVDLFVFNKWKQTRIKTHLVRTTAAKICRVLGVRIDLAGNLENQASNALIVSNHLSYVDILVLSTWRPTCFVTSVEMRDTPILGLICRLANCLFVERRSLRQLNQEVAELTEALRNGLNVTVFPEATSTNGDTVLKFRRPLYRAAIESQVPVLPICLNYRSVGSKPLARSNRDFVFWYGDMPFVGHLWALAGQGGLKIEISVLPVVHSQEANNDPKQLAEKTHTLVSSAYSPCLS